jgi:hypothetical protein
MTGGSGGINAGGGAAGTGGPTACASDKVCTPLGQLCDTARSVCVDCLADTDCGTDAVCTAGSCQAVVRCTDSRDCPADQVCDGAAGRCVQCMGDNDCAVGSRCIATTCRASCTTDKDCTGMGQLCNLVNGYCVDCVQDADCGASAHCDVGACVANACTPLSTTCLGSQLLTCDARGGGYVSQTCPVSCSESGGAHCSSGAGGAGGGGTGGTTGCAGLTANPCTTIPRFTGTQVVDGFDNDFCNVPGYVMDLANAGYVNATTTPVSATRTVMRIAWSTAGLHGFVHVDDPNVIVVGNFYDGDNVQFFISAERPVSGLPPTDGGDQLYTAPPFGTNPATSQVTYITTTARQVVGQIVAGGYDIEVLWPWSAATTAMTSGKIIGFDVMVGVNDTSTASARDFEYGIVLRTPITTTTCPSTTIQMYCDDRTWCEPVLQ